MEHLEDSLGRQEGEQHVFTRLLAALDDAPLLMGYVDGDLQIRYANHTHQKWFGVSSDRIVGLTVRELVGETLWPLLEPILTRVFMGHRVHTHRRINYPTGVRDVEAVYLPQLAQDGRTVGFVYLVREEAPQQARAARDEADRLRAELTAVVEQIPVGVAVAEAPSGRLLVLNPRMEQIVGTSFRSRTIEGYSYYEGYHPDGRPVQPNEWPLSRAILYGEKVADERYQFPRPDGSRTQVEISAAPVNDSHGNRIAAVVVAHDVTFELKHAEALESWAKDREQLIGMVSHDLRNPLHAIALSTAMLSKSGSLTPPQEKSIRRIDSSVQRMTRLISDLLDYEKSRSGSLPVQKVPMDFAAAVRAALEELKTTWPGRAVELHSPPSLLGQWDPERVKQVTVNLVSNALEHGSADHPIAVRIKGTPQIVTLKVYNRGPPIPHELLVHLFDPRGRSPEAQAKVKGTGLGLFIVRAVVTAHGGNVQVTSTEAETVFSTIWPRTS